MKNISISSRGRKIRPGTGLLLLGLGAGVLVPTFARADIHPVAIVAEVDLNINVAPPEPRHEVIVERDRPSRDHVWVPGFWEWRHDRHYWVAGHWERPPHGMHEWVEPRWEHRDHNYVFIRGFWR